ncbi:MAG: DEAD/DEAH box helicase family protein [Gemmatimonadota bacterium]|nr:DEAD/DEAH box helicase family protein [Gemmatimonadota bacterium]
MARKYLFEILDSVSEMGLLKIDIPTYVIENLNNGFEPRPYQREAFARFFHCLDNDFPGKERPLHFLFNMATGSGKTLIMAGLILYLYEKGYRNFLFFVNSTNVIEKTRDNFLNPSSMKYLFREEIRFAERLVRVSAVENFEGVNENDINICFTTIQKLHSDLTVCRENAITTEDFRKHRIVLIADEAHHMNVTTKSQHELMQSWENTVERIFGQNEYNLLLEFTATHDYIAPEMASKYSNKVLYRYDLLQFRNECFSKDVVIVQSDMGLNERIIQALILSQYKQEVAAKYRINLKPVIMFKAQRTIAQSRVNKANFHELVGGLSADHIRRIRRSNISIIQRAFRFFDDNNIGDEQLAERIRRGFQEDYCLSVNDEREKESYQILVNTLEDYNNRIRAIFAVQKLNEGWDVLNLFDIVRCYETRDSGKNRIGKTTISEAQLIGRGARYFPFVVEEPDDRFRRKFDTDLGNELRVLEELHYHSINDSRYIAEIRTALVNQGMMDEEEVTRDVKLKQSFKESDFYKYGVVWRNDRRIKNYRHVRSLTDLGVKKRNYIHIIATGLGGTQSALGTGKVDAIVKDEARRDLNVTEIESNIVKSAIARNRFFRFDSISRYFPNLKSISEFITSEEYLGGLMLTFEGDLFRLDENRAEKLAGVSGLLRQIETEIRQQITEYEGTREFRPNRVHEVFTDKVLKFDARNPLATEDAQFEYFASVRSWFAFNTVYGTSEEKAFVRMLDRQIQNIRKSYDEIYLLRNERQFAIYRFADGQAFEPDFVLFLRERCGELSVFQLFIEPKGKHLKEHDHWKEVFLKEITSQFNARLLRFDNKDYRLIGVPFYNNEDENEFRSALNEALDSNSN